MKQAVLHRRVTAYLSLACIPFGRRNQEENEKIMIFFPGGPAAALDLFKFPFYAGSYPYVTPFPFPPRVTPWSCLTNGRFPIYRRFL